MTKLTESDLDAAIADKAWPPRRAPGGIQIGHGPLAETAAEPIEFTRLIQQIKQGRIVSDWPDTIPTDWSDLTPQHREDPIGGIRGLVLTIGITGVAIAVWLLLASAV